MANKREATVVEVTEAPGVRRSVIVSFAINFVEAVGLGIASCVTGSVALRAQTANNVADLAVGAFLSIAVFSSARPTDESHPLGYGRDRFFWSLFAALGLCVGGGGFALESAIRSALHPSALDSYRLAYLVLAATVVLDAFGLIVSLPPIRAQAETRGKSLWAHLLRNSDPALTTVAVSNGAAVIGGLIAAVGLAVSQLMRSPTPDTLASGLIGILLLATSVFLLLANRELLIGRGVAPSTLKEMRKIVCAQSGVLEVPDLFAVFVGASSVIVSGDVTFDIGISVTALEEAIAHATTSLRERWPAIEYVYLTPVTRARKRRMPRAVKDVNKDLKTSLASVDGTRKR